MSTKLGESKSRGLGNGLGRRRLRETSSQVGVLPAVLKTSTFYHTGFDPTESISAEAGARTHFHHEFATSNRTTASRSISVPFLVFYVLSGHSSYSYPDRLLNPVDWVFIPEARYIWSFGKIMLVLMYYVPPNVCASFIMVTWRAKSDTIIEEAITLS
jgi:hypothetical protein